jgi:hypothetical protein
MLKMDVASLLSDLGPSAGPQRSKNIPTKDIPNMHGPHNNAHEYT